MTRTIKRSTARRCILAGQEYKADEDGYITVPFSNRPGSQPIILSRGEFASFDRFEHQSEKYSFVAGIHVDRESLLKRRQAQVVVRPGLFLNGVPVTLSILKDVVLVMTSTDHDGIATSKEVKDFQLFEDRESNYEFQVPQRLSAIQFTLKAKVKNLSNNRDDSFAANDTFSVNQIDHTEKVEDLHFAKMGDAYLIELLGKTGESRVDRPVQLSFKHRDFKRTVSITLKTDERGRVDLGALADIATVTATGPEKTAHTWNLLKDQHTYAASVNGNVGESISLPYMGTEKNPARDELSLLEVRGNTFVADRFASVSIKNGFLNISKLPRGDYDLLLKDSGERIRLRLTEGEQLEDYVLGPNRRLELRNSKPLQIQSVSTDDENINIRVRNSFEIRARSHFRHALSTRFFSVWRFRSRSRCRAICSLCVEVCFVLSLGAQYWRRIPLHHRSQIRDEIPGQHARTSELVAQSVGHSQNPNEPAKRGDGRSFCTNRRTVQSDWKTG